MMADISCHANRDLLALYEDDSFDPSGETAIRTVEFMDQLHRVASPATWHSANPLGRRRSTA